MTSAIGRRRSSSRSTTVMPRSAARCGVLARVGERLDADLHDRGAREPGLDQLPHGRPVRDAVAQVVVGVDGDEAAARRGRARRARWPSCRRRWRSSRSASIAAIQAVGVHRIRIRGVAGIDDPQPAVSSEYRRSASRTAAGRQVRLRRRQRPGVGRDAGQRRRRHARPRRRPASRPARGQSGSCGERGSRPNPRAWGRARRGARRPRSPRRIRRPRAGSRPCRDRCAARARSSRRRAACRRRP